MIDKPTNPIMAWDGTTITRPGFYAGVPMSAYHSGQLCSGPTLTSSGMRKITRLSEAHFFDTWPLNPEYDKAAFANEADALLLGRALHHLTLGMPAFKEEFAFEPDTLLDSKGNVTEFSYRLNSAKEWRAEMQAAGITVLGREMKEQILGMSQRLAREKLVIGGALNGHVEITMAWKDRISGVWFLNRPDVIPNHSGDFVDVKTIGRGKVVYGDLVRAIGDHLYHMQAALCREGYHRLTGREMTSFSLYFIESARPYCARMVQLKDRDLDLGWRQCRLAVDRFVQAFNSGVWPGPGGPQATVDWIDLSEGKRAAIERELKMQGDTGEMDDEAA